MIFFNYFLISPFNQFFNYFTTLVIDYKTRKEEKKSKTLFLFSFILLGSGVLVYLSLMLCIKTSNPFSFSN